MGEEEAFWGRAALPTRRLCPLQTHANRAVVLMCLHTRVHEGRGEQGRMCVLVLVLVLGAVARREMAFPFAIIILGRNCAMG